MPLLRNADRTKISKRKNPVSLNWYRDEGYLKEGIVNFLGLMGYSFGENKEIFTLEEFKDNFNIDKVSLGGPVFDLVKLGWVNNQHMRMKDLDELSKLAVPFFQQQGHVGKNVSEKEYEAIVKIVGILRESAQTLKEIAVEATAYYQDEFELPEVTEEMNKKERKSVEKLCSSIEDPVGKDSIKLFMEKLEKWEKDEFTVEEAKDLLHHTMDEIGEGPAKVFMPLRAVITGQARGADLFNVLYIIGKERTLKRMKAMIAKYNVL